MSELGFHEEYLLWNPEESKTRDPKSFSYTLGIMILRQKPQSAEHLVELNEDRPRPMQKDSTISLVETLTGSAIT